MIPPKLCTDGGKQVSGFIEKTPSFCSQSLQAAGPTARDEAAKEWFVQGAEPSRVQNVFIGQCGQERKEEEAELPSFFS